MNDFILQGETLSPKACLQVFHENTSRYKKRKKNYYKLNYLQEFITVRYITYYGIKIISNYKKFKKQNLVLA